ncbi:MAG: hypothetical protein GC189_08835 [Alphaproteobacteria bacterium]|nr:hypothetical protein [Alphaproteobacteria bacterium]
MRVICALHPHPSGSAAPAIAVEVDAQRLGAALSLVYRVTGDIGAIAWPTVSPSLRTDELWKRTCFEAFLRADGGDAYIELNFSPSTQWAAYRFDGYRAGVRAFDVAAPIILHGSRGAERRTSPRGEGVSAQSAETEGAAAPPPPLRCARDLPLAGEDGVAETICVEVDLSSVKDLATVPWRVGLSAVIETIDGGKSYWAIAHPSERPDFHHSDSFVCELAP